MYNGNRLIPAPLVRVSKQYQRAADQSIIGSIFQLTVTGTTVAYMGSPTTDGAFWTAPGFPPDESIPDISRLKAIIRKQEAIRELFSQEGYLFEIQSADGSAPMKCNPRVMDITFNEGLWYDRVEYSITLECDVLYVNGQELGEDGFTDLISDASESWAFEVDETPEGIDLPRTYRLSHTISATGKRFFDEAGTLLKPAWKQAEAYVLARVGYSPLIAQNSGVNNLPDHYGGYNFSRTSQQDVVGGNYSLTESWILASGKALEDFNCEIKNDPSNGATTVTLAGTITGLEERDGNMGLLVKKYTNASDKWTSVQDALLSRAQNYSGLTLNPFPLSKLVGKNDINGVITYSYDYDTRPTNLFSGVTYEGITISENRPADLFASIPVLGRANGPVLQGLSSYQERSVSLNIELIVQPNTFGAGTVSEIRSAFYNNPRVAQPDIFDKIIQAARPSIYYSTNYEYVRTQPESFDVKTGRYSYSIEWVFGN